MLRPERTYRGGGLLKLLLRKVHLIGMLREVLDVFGLDLSVQLLESVDLEPREQFHLVSPDNRDAHALSSVGYDSTGQVVRVHFHEVLLVEAEVGEELSVLLEVLSRLLSSVGPVLRLIRLVGLQESLVLKEAALRDEHLDVVEEREVEQLPVDLLEDFALRLNDLISSVPVADLVVQGVGAGILDLQVLAGDEQAAEADEQRVVLLVLRDLRRVEVHQVHGVVDGLVV